MSFLLALFCFLEYEKSVLYTESEMEDEGVIWKNQGICWDEKLTKLIIDQCFLNLSVHKNIWDNILKHRFLGSHSWRFWLSQYGAQEFAFLVSNADLVDPSHLCYTTSNFLLSVAFRLEASETLSPLVFLEWLCCCNFPASFLISSPPVSFSSQPWNVQQLAF